jgi:hypothetical protein
MKRFMFLSIGVLCLAVAALIGFYVGSQRAEAQASPDAQYFVFNYGSTSCSYRAILPNGDIYSNSDNGAPYYFAYPAHYIGNFWGGTVATDKSTWSGVKGQFNK